MTRHELAAWVAGYERAWRTAGTSALGELFSTDAVYSTAPFDQPVRGLDAIAELWERERAGPDEAFEMTSEVIAVEADTGVVRIEVRYGEPLHQLFRDLWVVRLGDDGRCTRFEEWPFWPPGTAGATAGGE